MGWLTARLELRVASPPSLRESLVSLTRRHQSRRVSFPDVPKNACGIRNRVIHNWLSTKAFQRGARARGGGFENLLPPVFDALFGTDGICSGDAIGRWLVRAIDDLEARGR